MSLKDKLTSLLFGTKPEETADELADAEQKHMAQADPENPVQPTVDPALLELPTDHPLHRLCDLRGYESGHPPTPRLSLDEDGILPPDMIQQEKKRLQPSFRNACSMRLKEIQNMDENRQEDQEEQEEAPALALDALPWFFLSADKLYAWLLVFPPVGQGAELSREMLYRALDSQGISYGINTSLTERLARGEGEYCQLYLVAQGKPAVHGKDGYIIENFPRKVQRQFQVNEYDQVDYADLNLIQNAQQGQEICRLVPPTEGEPGCTILNEELPAKSGKSVPLPKGRNTEISEDGLSLIATIAGHVEFTGRSFQVRTVMDVPGDVDFSTGDISFLGDVNIKGNVRSGFTVRAIGNIQVGGMIEPGSAVEAGGDLTVGRGILGDGTTIIRSQRCIFSKYIENAILYVRENLQTDCILNGNIYCDGEVQVRSGRGSIMGGRVWAAKKISATAVGARSECRTSIVLGGRPCTDFERELLLQELRDLKAEQEKLACQVDSPSKSGLLGKVRMKVSVAEHKLKQLEAEIEESKGKPKEKESGKLECSVAYPGTELIFGDGVLLLQHEYRQCVAKLQHGEIVVI